MATIQFEIELPEELLGLLRKSREEMEAEVRLAVALHLFRERKVSAGKAAEIAGLCLSDFMESSRQHQINWVEDTDEEVEAEVHQSIELGQSLRNEPR